MVKRLHLKSNARFRSRALAIFAAIVACTFPARAQDDFEARLKTIVDAYAAVELNAADPVTPDQALYQGAIPGLLRNLDPHSVFFTPDQMQQLKSMETSTRKGFGSVVSILPGRVIVLQTLPGTPSAKAGLSPGEDIVAVNGYEIARLDLDQITELLTETRQREAVLFVRQPGESRLRQVKLVPEELQESSVDRTFFVGAGIGYVRISSFEEPTPKELKDAIEKLGGQKLRGLVLDLRDNPGGVFEAGLQVASMFLPAGAEIVSVNGRNVPERAINVPEGGTPYRFKLALLMNGKSASASEIVAGAMQDHDRATILGEPSFGKGLVQSVFPLSEGTGIALTTALYYTPSGRSIQKPLDASKFELAGATSGANSSKTYHTDKGRVVAGGGGIAPDYVVYPARMSRFREALEASASFTGFATELTAKEKVTSDFEITPAMLDQFKVYLSARGIQPGMNEWTAEREFITNRLLTEVFNQTVGVAKGDEVGSQRDPVIQKAVEILGS